MGVAGTNMQNKKLAYHLSLQHYTVYKSIMLSYISNEVMLVLDIFMRDKLGGNFYIGCLTHRINIINYLEKLKKTHQIQTAFP